MKYSPRTSRSLEYKIKQNHVSTQFVPLNTNFKQGVLQEIVKEHGTCLLGAHKREETKW